MTRWSWPKVAGVFIICLAVLTFCYMVGVTANHAKVQEDKNMRFCIEHGGQWSHAFLQCKIEK